MTLALEQRIIPPNILFDTPSPKIPFDECKLTVPVEPMPWPAGRLERVGVNSFGIGGSNAHVLLESAAHHGVERVSLLSPPDASTGHSSALLLFSAKHSDALRKSFANHESYLQNHPNAVQDLSWSLAMRREKLPYRAFAVAHGSNAWVISRTHKGAVKARPPRLVFVFSGQGAQWAQMGRDLMESRPVFRETIARLDSVLASLPSAPEWTLKG